MDYIVYLPYFYFISESEEEFGDLYLDIAEAYKSSDYHEAALPILHPLINSNHYNVAAVWLQYGECLAAVDQMEEAAQAYSQVSRSQFVKKLIILLLLLCNPTDPAQAG